MSLLSFTPTPIAGVTQISRRRLGDERGFLTRVFCAAELKAAGFETEIAQINHSYSATKGTLRGMHFQYPPHAETKIVQALRGAVFDVALDLRAGSATFGHWTAAELSAENGMALLIPPGVAHGFQALTDDVELLYLHSAAYAPDHEGGVFAQDKDIRISWPLPITVTSPRDQALPPLRDIRPIALSAVIAPHP